MARTLPEQLVDDSRPASAAAKGIE